MFDCSFCAGLTGGQTVPHTRFDCRRRRSTYCHVCCAYGHSVQYCPDKIAVAVRQGKSIVGVKNLIVRIEKEQKSIAAYLKQHGITATKSMEENELLLHHLVNSLEPPRLLVLLPPRS